MTFKIRFISMIFFISIISSISWADIQCTSNGAVMGIQTLKIKNSITSNTYCILINNKLIRCPSGQYLDGEIDLDEVEEPNGDIRYHSIALTGLLKPNHLQLEEGSICNGVVSKQRNCDDYRTPEKTAPMVCFN